MIDIFSTEIIGAFLTGVAGPVLLEWVRNRKESKSQKQKDLVRESLETNLKVERKIDEIKERYDVDRVYIFQFHNGGYFYPTGKSIQKFSMCYEGCKPGIVPIQFSFQNIPISLFSKAIDYIQKNGLLAVPDYDDQTYVDSLGLGLKGIENVTRNQSAYNFAIKSIDDKFIGILGLNWIDSKRDLTDLEITQIALEVSSIGGELMQLLKSK